jgi:hypothetical protein
MAYSDRSISSSSSASSPPSHLVALPSVGHSLQTLPTLSALPADMLHYSNSGTHSRAKVSSRDVHLQSAPLTGSIDGLCHAKAETTRNHAFHCSAQCTLVRHLSSRRLTYFLRHTTCDVHPVRHAKMGTLPSDDTPTLDARPGFDGVSNQDDAFHAHVDDHRPLRHTSDDSATCYQVAICRAERLWG